MRDPCDPLADGKCSNAAIAPRCGAAACSDGMFCNGIEVCDENGDCEQAGALGVNPASLSTCPSQELHPPLLGIGDRKTWRLWTMSKRDCQRFQTQIDPDSAESRNLRRRVPYTTETPQRMDQVTLPGDSDDEVRRLSVSKPLCRAQATRSHEVSLRFDRAKDEFCLRGNRRGTN